MRFWSDDGVKTFKSEVFTPVDGKRPQWLPNLERPTGHNSVSDKPGVIYTVDDAGDGSKDLELKNEVWWKTTN